MARQSNTTTTGGAFDYQTIQAVWEKAQAVLGYDPTTLRKDSCGAWITRSAYGSTEDNGWEVDHIKPVAKGGSDSMSNLQPLQWQNNRHKSDDWPNYTCAVRAR